MAEFSRTPAPVKTTHVTQWNGAAGFDDEDGPAAVVALEAALASRREAVRMCSAPEPVGGAIAAQIARDAEVSEVEVVDDGNGQLEVAPFVVADFGDDDDELAMGTGPMTPPQERGGGGGGQQGL